MRRLRRALYSIVVLVIILVLAEVAVRIFRKDTSFIIPDSRLGYVNQPGFQGSWGKTRKVEVRIDDGGFRVPRNFEGRDPESLRIVCMGDSCTFGFDVEAEESYPEKLGELIDRKVEIFNAGGHRLLDAARGEALSRPDRSPRSRHRRHLVQHRQPDHPLPDSPDLSTPTFWTSGPLARIARKSELFNWIYDL